MNMQVIWDQLSDDYQQRTERTDLTYFSYGPFAPTDDELQLLGPLTGLHVLDIGCGGGQNTVALAHAGAHVTGLDISARQLAHARAASAAASSAIRYIHNDAEQTSEMPSAAYDMLTCIYTLPYLSQPKHSLMQWHSLLRTNGRLLISFDHPLYACFMDRERADLAGFPLHCYHEEVLLRWPTNVPGVDLPYSHRPIAAWIADMVGAGFRLNQLLEPTTPTEILDHLWPKDSSLAPIRNIPHTLIFDLERVDMERGSAH